jgi:succinoglycan biosynthesis transport protein ExoP
MITPRAKTGVLEVLANQIILADAKYVDDRTGRNFLSAVLTPRMVHTNEILASNELKKLVENLRKAYDYVIIDFAPLAPVVDVRATTEIVDFYVYAVEWAQREETWCRGSCARLQSFMIVCWALSSKS